MKTKYGIAEKWDRLLSLDKSFPDVIKSEILKRIIESEAYTIISRNIHKMDQWNYIELNRLAAYKTDFIRIMGDMISEAIQAIAEKYQYSGDINYSDYIIYDKFYMETFDDAESIHDIYWSDILITPSIAEWPNDKYFCVDYEGLCRNSLGINLNVLETAFHKLVGPDVKDNINHSMFSTFKFCPALLNPKHDFKIGLWYPDFKIYVPGKEEYNENGYAIKYIDSKTGEDKVSYGKHFIFPKEIAELLRVEPGYSMHEFYFDEKYTAYFYEEKH